MATAEATRIAVDPSDDEGVAVETDLLLDHLSDDHARDILHALGVSPQSAAALTERLPISRATVYRRLDDLVAAGLVDSHIALAADGHHRKQFYIVVNALTLQFGDDGVSIDATAAELACATPTTTAIAEPAALLDALGDKYTRAVIAAVGEGSLPARAVVERTGASRPTVYHRLNRLAELGVVETVDAVGPDGQQRQQYRIAVDEIDISLVDGSAVDTERTPRQPGENSQRQQPNSSEQGREPQQNSSGAGAIGGATDGIDATDATDATNNHRPAHETPRPTPSARSQQANPAD
jgi:DNA-binding transcriptional ArsR family regulator